LIKAKVSAPNPNAVTFSSCSGQNKKSANLGNDRSGQSSDTVVLYIRNFVNIERF